ncbi:ATP-binding protein [Conexibacter woesei]|uniref:ATP-binding protein n=1 Tax=Conexibacter woesei TaxID=191495 RepID=UPI0004795954|nr:ATP-binding protein [Conexibacter woesei]
MSFRAVAEPATLGSLRDALGAFLDETGAGEQLRFDVMLAVSEAANNVLLHAYRTCAQPGAIRVAATAGTERIEVTIEDDGGGLAPRPDSPGAGLGLPMMAQLTDDLDVRRLPAGGTSVAMAWRRTA